MGALLLGGSVVQNSLPVWAATTDTLVDSEETTTLVDQLNQTIAQAKAKVAGATESTPDLTGGSGHVPSLANLEDAITAASEIDQTDDSAVQRSISKLQDKVKNFDSDYANGSHNIFLRQKKPRKYFFECFYKYNNMF